MRIYDIYPDAASVLTAPLPDVAAAVLAHLADGKLRQAQDADCSHNFLIEMAQHYSVDAVAVMSEAWGWLRNRDLICQHPRHSEGWVTLTRLGRQLAAASNLQAWVQERDFPAEHLHSLVRDHALPLFRQGRFDTAVFEAFKSLEVRIREVARLGHDLVGVKLASRAFHPETGELTDQAAEAGERVALGNLMTGALGSYKNPQSHRHVGVEPEEAREMITLASHLLRIVDSRDPGPTA